MRLPALLKTLLLGITLIAAPALDEEAVPLDANGRVPVGFKGDDAETIYDTLFKLPELKKDQFETEAEYQTRLRNLDKKAITFDNGKNLGSKLVMQLRVPRSLHDYYNAETRTLTVKEGGQITFDIHAWDDSNILLDGFIMATQEQDLGSYIGSNAFGKEVRITKRKVFKVVVGESRPIGLTSWGGHEKFDEAAALKLEPAKAREAMGHTRMLVIASLKQPFFYRGWTRHAPTISEPWDVNTELKVLLVDPEELWVYNEENGEIYKKVKLKK